MSFKLELPAGTFLVSRNDLRRVLQELIEEGKEDKPSQEIMTIKEAADYLKVSVPTVRTMISNKEIPFFKRGQVIRLNRLDVKEWVRKKSNHAIMQS